MGEAHHLSHTERVQVIKTTRHALDEAGLSDVPIIAGSGGGSTRETLELCNEAASAGADAVIVITSGYYAGVLAGNKRALKAFFTEVSEKSPLPVMVYNCTLSEAEVIAILTFFQTQERPEALILTPTPSSNSRRNARTYAE